MNYTSDKLEQAKYISKYGCSDLNCNWCNFINDTCRIYKPGTQPIILTTVNKYIRKQKLKKIKMKDWDKIEKRTDEINKIFDETESELHKLDGEDNAFLGLQIISKYTKKNIIVCAEHDIIYSIGIEEAIELNVTDEDFIQLAKLNWMIYEGEGLACFV